MKEGIVYKTTGIWHTVKDLNGEFYPCRIKGKFRTKSLKSTNPIAVGDRVQFILSKDDDRSVGLIFKICERENYIVRKSVNLSKQVHIIAANIHQVFLFITLKNPETTYLFIDRFLVSAMARKIDVILLFNKIDSYGKEEIEKLKKMLFIYENIGYKALKISSFNEKDVFAVKKIMNNKVSIFSGHSGVGKSTLLNSIYPGLKIKTTPVSNFHKLGQHTTTFSQMYDLDDGIRIIDTPGIKGFGIVEIKPKELENYFIEFKKYKEKCNFNDCIHLEEPKCGVKLAVKENNISQIRYNNYIKLLGDDKTYRFKSN